MDRVNEIHREVTSFRKYVVPEVLEVQVVPLSDEVRMIPEAPTVTKVLFAYLTPFRVSVVPEVLEVHGVM